MLKTPPDTVIFWPGFHLTILLEIPFSLILNPFEDVQEFRCIWLN